MRKIIILSFLSFVFCITQAQVTNVTDYRIQNASTAFGRSIAIGTKVYNVATEEYWVAIAPVASTATLTTAAASFELLNQVGTDAQTLSTTGAAGNISILNGNTVNLNVDDADANATNEIQTLDVAQLNGTTLELSLSSDGEATKQIALSSLQDGTGTDDQTLSIDSTGRQFTISIEDGNSVTFVDTNTQLDETAVDNYVANNGYYTTIDTNDVTGLLEFVENHSDVGGSTVSEKITVSQTTHGLAVDDWIRFNGTSYIKAQANTPENAEVIGVVDSVLDANTFRYQFSGLYTKGTYTNGAAYFLSPDVSGDAIITPTYETGEVQLFLGTGTPAGFIIEIDVGIEISIIDGVDSLIAGNLVDVNVGVGDVTIDVDLTELSSDETAVLTDDIPWLDASNGQKKMQLSTLKTLVTTAQVYPGAGIAVSTGSAWGTSITDNSSNWNTAYGWGNWASNFGTTAGTIAQGNDSRILNGQTAYDNRIASFTTTGSSGAATFSSNTLNIPNYTLSGLGGMPLSGGTFTGTVTTKKQRLTVLNGSQTGTFTHDSNNGDVGAYRVNAASTTLSIHNLASGDQGTIFLNFVTTTPTSLTVNTFSDAGSTGLTEVVIGSTPTLAINKSTSITYTCANDGTNTYVYLVYGQQP